MPAYHGGDCVVTPHVASFSVGKVVKLARIVLGRPAVRLRAIRSATGGIHGQRDIATAGPMFGPFGERLPATAVNKDDRGKRTSTFCWPAEICEDACWFSMERLALIINLLYESCARSPFRGGCFFQ